MSDTHALVRTSPKGQPFIGKCAKCGVEELPISAASQPCVNPAGMNWGEGFDLINRILDHRA